MMRRGMRGAKSMAARQGIAFFLAEAAFDAGAENDGL